jgi:hypothetical protein
MTKDRAERILDDWQSERDTEELVAMTGHKRLRKPKMELRGFSVCEYNVPRKPRREAPARRREWKRAPEAVALLEKGNRQGFEELGDLNQPLTYFSLGRKGAYCHGCEVIHEKSTMFYTPLSRQIRSARSLRHMAAADRSRLVS